MDVDARRLAALCELARAAGREVMQVYASPFEKADKADGSPVTQADLRADAVIREGLLAIWPDACIVSEESSPAIARAGPSFFLVDPLDGTKEFIARNGEFTVNIALVDQGQPIAGVVLAPASGELFYAARGLGAWKLEAAGPLRLQTVPVPGQGPLRVLGSRSHGSAATDRWLASLQRGVELRAVGSSLKFCRIAQGLADLYPRVGPTSQWDTAAGHAILAEAGGAVLDGQGAPLTYGAHRPLINPSFAAVGDPSLRLPPLPAGPDVPDLPDLPDLP